jgi:CBS domain-containing protein
MISETVESVIGSKQSQELVTVESSTPVSEAAALMSRMHVGSVLIRNAAGAVEGIFTERDLLRRVVGEGLDPRIIPIGQVMSPNVRRVAPTAMVEEALRLMVLHGHRHLLVDDGEKVHGLLSIRDLMHWLVAPDQPVASEGRVGVIRARAQDALEAVRTLDVGVTRR